MTPPSPIWGLKVDSFLTLWEITDIQLENLIRPEAGIFSIILHFYDAAVLVIIQSNNNVTSANREKKN